MKPIGIVQHQPSVPAGLIADEFRRAGVPHVTIRAWAESRWPTITDLSGLVVMGGTMNVDEIEAYPFLQRSRTLMSDAIDDGVPALGVCLGSQMMARVLGADVHRSDPRNALFSTLELTAEGRRDPVTEAFAGVETLQFHEDTFEVPRGAVPLATSSSSGLPQAFRFGDAAYAIQFHFEVNRQIVRGWLDTIGRRSMLDQWGCDPSDLLNAADRILPRQAAAGRALVVAFLALVRDKEGASA